MITLSSFLYDTAITLLTMTIFLGGLGILSIRKSLKEKIVFSREELFKKEEYYTPLQMFLSGFVLLGISLWYNFYKGHMFEYIENVQILLSNSKLDFQLVSIGPILLFFIILIAVFGGSFSNTYANKKNNFYILEYNKYDKIGGLITFIMIIIMIYADYENIDEVHEKLITLFLFLLGLIIFLYTRIKIRFNSDYIEFHTFWRPKRTILWKDVKSIRFEEKNNEYIRLTTKDNKKFIISARFNGLVSFMSTFKIRNKK